MENHSKKCNYRPTEACLFPSLNDSQNNHTQEFGLLDISEEATSAAHAFCDTKCVDLVYFLATVWTAVLIQYTRAEAVSFGVADGRVESREHQNGSKASMKIASALVKTDQRVGDLLRADPWAFESISPRSYESFNTGIILLSGLDRQGAPIASNDPDSWSHGTQLCDVTLMAHLHPTLPTLRTCYRESILSCDLAKCLVGAIEQAIYAITQDTTQPISSIDLVSSAQEGQIAKWNHYDLTAPPASVVNLIFDGLAGYQDRTVIHAWDGDLTVGELRYYMSKTAGHLKSLSIGPGVMIPLCFEKSKWAVVAMLGVLKTGAGFIPIEPSISAETLKTILGQTDRRVAITSSATFDLFRDHVETVVAISTASITLIPVSPREEECSQPISGDDPAYCLFTSGSTGTPKGCIISHRALANICNHTVAMDMHSESRLLQFASYAFTISLFEIFGTLIAGGTVCIPSTEDRYNNLVGVINTMNIDWAVLTPTTIKLFEPQDVPSLRTLVFGGEPINGDQIEVWADHVNLLQSYGMSETTGICAMSQRIQSVKEKRNIGRPVNAKFWLFREDDHSKLALIGAVAELVIEGPCIANGYLNLPQRTAESFVVNLPWLSSLDRVSGERKMYKSGDLVHYSTDGRISYIGRKDRQVKIRGQRLELGQIESYLIEAFPNIQKAIAEVVEPADGPGRLTLAVFLLTSDTQKTNNPRNSWVATRTDDFLLNIQQVLPIIKSKLPHSLIPQLFIPMTRVPVTWSGKADRQEMKATLGALTSLELHSRFGCAKIAAIQSTQWTDHARTIQAVWASALGIPQDSIGLGDNFFHIGGDSLVAMKVAALSRTEGLFITVSDLFRRPYISQLSTMIPTGAAKAPVESPVPFSLYKGDEARALLSSLEQDGFPFRQDTQDILPVTGQQMFFFNQWTIPCFPFLINGPLQVDRLRTACGAVIERHMCLRTIFTQSKDHGVVQIVLRKIKTPFRHITTDEDLGRAARSLADTAMTLPPLSTNRLPLQFTLLSKSSQQHAFLVQLSHSQMEGISLPDLFQDVNTAYNNSLSSLPPASSFSDYVYFTRQAHVRNAALDFWASYLHGSSITSPFLTIPALGSNHGKMPSDVITSTTSKLPPLPSGITVPTLVNAAFSLCLSQSVEQSEIVFGLVMSTRGNPVPGIKEILGPCNNNNPIRVRIDSSQSGLILCQALQEQYLQVSQYDWLDWGDIVSQCTDWPVDAKLGYLVSHVNSGMANLPLDLEGLECSSIPPAVRRKMQDQVLIRSLQQGQNLEIQVQTNSGIMDAEKAGLFGDRLLELVGKICHDPDRSSSDY